MKMQKEIGKVYLDLKCLDIDRFLLLIKDHEAVFPRCKMEIKKGDYDFVENYQNSWVRISLPEKGYKLITLDELDYIINSKNKRTKEVIESEIKSLQEELEELDKIKVGDVVLSPSNGIGVVINVDDSTVPYEVKGIGWCKVVTKLDTDLTIREALGL